MCTHIRVPSWNSCSPPSFEGLLGWRPSQERNELIVTLWLLLSISELSTAVDRRCPGLRPSITGPHHQETKQNYRQPNAQPRVKPGATKQTKKKDRERKGHDSTSELKQRSHVIVDWLFKRWKVKPCVKFGCWSWYSITTAMPGCDSHSLRSPMLK